MAALLLKDFPLDVRKIVIKKQGEIKNEREISQFSMELTMYKIIREWEMLNTKNKNKNQLPL